MTWDEHFRCDICGIFFRTRRFMAAHNEQHHPDNGWIVIPLPSEQEIEQMRTDLANLERELRS